MTEIAYHPTHVRALRETFKALRTSEFPWTADTIYLNNASIGPIPERTRRALDEFTAKRTAPHLLPDRELFAGLAAARLGIAQLINANPSEIALATNTGFGLNLAARALPLKRGDVVLLSDKEFPANVYPWLMLRDQGITVEMAREDARIRRAERTCRLHVLEPAGEQDLAPDDARHPRPAHDADDDEHHGQRGLHRGGNGDEQQQ